MTENKNEIDKKKINSNLCFSGAKVICDIRWNITLLEEPNTFICDSF